MFLGKLIFFVVGDGQVQKSTSKMASNPNTSSIQRTEPQEGQLLNEVLNGATSFVKNHKTISTGYLIGILLLVFATGFSVSDDLRDKYDRTLDKIDYEVKYIFKY